MRLSSDTVQVILIFIVFSLGIMALANTKKPVEKPYFEDKYDQRQFDNVGCRWGLILMILGAGGVLFGLYSMYEALHQ